MSLKIEMGQSKKIETPLLHQLPQKAIFRLLGDDNKRIHMKVDHISGADTEVDAFCLETGEMDFFSGNAEVEEYDAVLTLTKK